MQKAKPQMMDYVLLPIPEEIADELGLDPFSTIQFTISRGRLIIEPIDADCSMVCFGNCNHCPGRKFCEDAD